MQPLSPVRPQDLEPLKGPYSDDISDEDLDLLWGRMKPLVASPKDGELHWIAPPSDLRSIAYTWSPVLREKAEGLAPITTVRSLHSFAYYGLFKPSVAEVLAAIPPSLRDKAVAFHLQGPETADDLGHESEALHAGYQVAYATFYEKA